MLACMSKAFDTVNHKLLLKKLYIYGVRGNAHKLMESFLTNRKHQVKFNKLLSKSYLLKHGVPQGSCLGPLLYNIYTIDVENALTDCNLTIYADDLTIEISGNNIQQLESRANNILNVFENYCNFNYFSISVEKSYFMIFSNSSASQNINPSIYLCGKTLKKLQSSCYLGVHIDDKLKFRTQAEHIRSKLVMYKSISRKINNKLPLIPSKIFYFSLIQSQILYGLAVWGGTLFANDAHKDLQIKQDKIVKTLFSKFFPRKPLNELYKTVNIPTIKQLYKIHISLYLFDIINTEKFPQLKASINELIFNHPYNTRKNSLLIPLNNFNNFRHNFLYNGTKIWNSIPATIKNLPKKRFKTQVRKYFISAD